MAKEEVIKLKIEGKSYSEISRILGEMSLQLKLFIIDLRIAILNYFALCVQSS